MSTLRDERGKSGVVQLAGWYDDGTNQFLLLSTVGEPLERLCLCTAERRAAVRKAIVRDVGGALVRWHGEGKSYGDLFARNIVVAPSLEQACVTDLETLGKVVKDEDSPVKDKASKDAKKLSVGSVPRDLKFDIVCFANLVMKLNPLG